MAVNDMKAFGELVQIAKQHVTSGAGEAAQNS
jgi:hypothetical protein